MQIKKTRPEQLSNSNIEVYEVERLGLTKAYQ